MRRMASAAVLVLAAFLALPGRCLALGDETAQEGTTSLSSQGSDVLRVLANRYSDELHKNLQTHYILGYPADSPLFSNWAYGGFSDFGLEREAEARAFAISAVRLTGIQMLNELDVVMRVRKIVAQYSRVDLAVSADKVEFSGLGASRVTLPDYPRAFQSSFALSGGLPIGVQARFKVAGLEPRLTVYPGSQKILSASLERRLGEQTSIGVDYRLYRDRESVTATLSYAWSRDPQIPFWPAWLKFSN